VLPWAVPTLHSIVPFFIVDSLKVSLDFYCSKLGFDIAYKGGGDGQGEDFWAFVRRDTVMINLKQIAPDIHPVPNCSRHEWARWDAYVHTSDPDSLYREYFSKGVTIHRPLQDTDDGLRAFEILDNNGYVLCFGRPIESE
jgi:catechol 2,3-dioxygenase-like lactoylglutathione lyase family enzyme